MPNQSKAHMAKMTRRAKAARLRENTETMEEIEALIAEQSKPENLPKWWYSDFRDKHPRLGHVMPVGTGMPKSNGKKKRGRNVQPPDS